MRKRLAHAFHKAAHHPLVKHGHHGIYLVYYGLALLDDTGLRFWAVAGIFGFHVLATLTGEE